MQATDPQPTRHTPDLDATRRQLDQMLEHPSFSKSRRCEKLLRYLVGQALADADFHPKERTLGVEVFERKPDYDTAADPVVRTTANEIRKRLGAYYHDAGPTAVVYIDLPSGSYRPTFRTVQDPASERPPASVPAARRSLKDFRLQAASLAVALCVLAGGLLLLHERSVQSNFNRFWRPFLSATSRVLICTPNSNGDAGSHDEVQAAPAKVSFRKASAQNPSISLTDSKAVWRILSVLNNGPETILFRTSDRVSVSDLADGAAILIGGPENALSASLTARLRFTIISEPESHVVRIVDQWSPLKSRWSVDSTSPPKTAGFAYAVVSRVTNKPGSVIMDISGIGSHATAAAGDFVARSDYLNALGARLNGCDRNLQMVLRVPYNGGVVEAPEVEAVHCW